MKKLYFLMLIQLVLVDSTIGQCTSSPYGAWGSLTPTCNGTYQNVTTCGYRGEYSTITVTQGNNYSFQSSITSDYITIATTANAPLVWGTGTVTWTATFSGQVRFFTHTNSACGAATGCMTRRVMCTAGGPPPSPCSGAINITSLPVNNQTVVCSSSNNLNSSNVPACGAASTSYMGGNEALYTVTPTTSGTYTISYSGQTWSSIWVWANACPTSGGTCVGSVSGSGSSQTLNVNLTAGVTYYVMFDTWPSPVSPCPGTFSITPPVPQFNPCSSIPNITACGASVSTTWTAGQTGAWSPVANSCGWTTPGQERIWTFTPSVSGTYQLNISTLTGGYVNAFYKEASTGCANSNWTCIGDFLSPGTYNGVNPICLTAGIQYYFMFDPEHTNAGSLTFNLVCPTAPTLSANTTSICEGQTVNFTGSINPVLLNAGQYYGYYWVASFDNGTTWFYQNLPNNNPGNLGVPSYNAQQGNNLNLTVPPGNVGNILVERWHYDACGYFQSTNTIAINVNSFGVDGSISPTTPINACLGQPITVAAAGGTGVPKYWVQSPPGSATWNVFENQPSNSANNGFTFTPTAPGSYRVHTRWETNCGFCWDLPGHDWSTNNNCTSFAYVDFIVSEPNTPPTLSGGGTVCLGQQITLNANGGNTPSNQWSWHQGNSNNPAIGSGTSLTVPASGGTTSYVVSVPANGGCPAANSNTVQVVAPNPINALSPNNATSQCLVNQNGWVHFLDNGGRLIASVNSNGQNLGNMVATSYVEATPLIVQSCTNPTPLVATSVMDRHWVITAQNQPSSPVEVRLPFTSGQLSSLSVESFDNPNPDDDVLSANDIVLTKFSGPGFEDNSFTNNCGNGVIDLYTQNGNGNVSSYLSPITDAAYVDFSINSFSEFWLHGSSSNSPLPVKLTAFQANCNDAGYVTVSWQTESEMNSSHFIVERSRDGYNWLAGSAIPAAGFSNALKNYSYADMAAGGSFEGYYRLRQVDFDGVEEMFGPISVSCTSFDFPTMEVYPNPSNGKFALRIYSSHSDADALVMICNSNGQTVHQREVSLQHGVTTVLFDQGNLERGVYFIRIIGNTMKLSPQKLIIN